MADWAAQPRLLTVCTVVLAVTQGFGSARKRFLCRRCQERRRETESSRCLPGPSALLTTSKRAGEAPTKPGLSSQPLTRSTASSRGREWLLDGGCAELKAHFSLFLSPQAQTRGGCSAGAQGVVQVRVAQSRAAEHQPGSGFRGGRGRNPSSGFTDQEMQHQMPSHNSCSTFGKTMRSRVSSTCKQKLHDIYNPEQVPKPNSHQLVRHTKKTMSSKTR